MVEDVQRLKDRVENLDRHFGTVNKDIEQIVISADKILTRGEKIKDVEFSEEPSGADIIPVPLTRRLGVAE
jgi:DNA recombination protein RmuC